MCVCVCVCVCVCDRAPKPWKTKTYVYKHIKEYVRQEGMEEKRVAKEEAKRLKNAAAL